MWHFAWPILNQLRNFIFILWKFVSSLHPLEVIKKKEKKQNKH